ncbi:MAG: restriction endonuclease subunit S, partial [Alphaproteobacteria bacterium]|nr:restriction endonuclease subunit S [Alphaproteobacteria bacterium]
NQTLEAMAQAIFKSWFVDFDPVKAKIAAIAEGRDPLRAAMSAISGKPDADLDALPPEHYEQIAATAALFPNEMEDSELGEIPKGWSFSKVETLLTRLSAKTRYTKEQISEYGQIPVFEQGASILMGYHNGTASYQASAENPMFIFGDHTCVTRLSCQPFDISQNVIPLQGQDRATSWVYYAIKEKQQFQEYRRHWMELISKDVVVATANVCLEFSKKVSGAQLQIEANERQMQGLRELRNTLLPKLLSGELSVTEAMVEAES